MKDAYLLICQTVQTIAAALMIGVLIAGIPAAFEVIENTRQITDAMKRRRIFSDDLQAECDCLKCRCCVACKGR